MDLLLSGGQDVEIGGLSDDGVKRFGGMIDAMGRFLNPFLKGEGVAFASLRFPPGKESDGQDEHGEVEKRDNNSADCAHEFGGWIGGEVFEAREEKKEKMKIDQPGQVTFLHLLICFPWLDDVCLS